MSKDHDDQISTSWLHYRPPSSSHQTAPTRFTGGLSRQVIVQYLEEALRILQDDDDHDDDGEEEELQQDNDTKSFPPPSPSSNDS
jgi:hypothetical protein